MPKKGHEQTQDQKIKKLEQIVMSAEHKRSNFSTYNFTDGVVCDIATAGIPRRFVNVAQGLTVVDRVGNELRLKKLQYRALLSNGDTSPSRVRFLVFEWFGKAAPVLADILNSAVGAGLPAAELTPVNPISLQKKLLKIHKDETCHLEGITVFNGIRQHTFKYRKTWKLGKKILYDGVNAGSQVQGLYYMICANAGTVTQPSVEDATYIEFTDD